MSADEFTEVTTQSWGSRIGGSFKGILIGLLMVVAALVLLFWNEGRAVQTAKSLKEGAGAVVSVPAKPVDPGNNGKLVHVTGLATTQETLRDPEFLVEAKGLRLRRVVLMYQWQERSRSETKKKLGGGTETVTTYTYSKVWSPRPIDSASFKKPQGHANPGSMPFHSQDQAASKVTVGDYYLSPGLVNQVEAFKPLRLERNNYQIPAALGRRAKFYGGGLYIGYSPASPRVGDLRVSFEVVEPTTVSIVARQQGNGFTGYQTEAGDELLMLKVGQHTAASMFKAALSSNRTLTWIMRLVGLVLMFIGFSTILRPLSVMLDVLPLLGNIAGVGTSIVAGLLALGLSLITIGIAWVVYRPLLGVIILVVGVGSLVLLKITRSKKAAPARETPAPSPPPPPPPPAQ